jgi:hypothetical protein
MAEWPTTIYSSEKWLFSYHPLCLAFFGFHDVLTDDN